MNCDFLKIKLNENRTDLAIIIIQISSIGKILKSCNNLLTRRAGYNGIACG